MKAFSKGFAFVPLLVVLFLLIVSAVTSYVVINQGTGGYKSRAGGATCSVGAEGCGPTKSCRDAHRDKYGVEPGTGAPRLLSKSTCENLGSNCKYKETKNQVMGGGIKITKSCDGNVFTPGKCSCADLTDNGKTNCEGMGCTWTTKDNLGNNNPRCSGSPSQTVIGTSNATFACKPRVGSSCNVGLGSACGQPTPDNLNCSPKIVGCTGTATCQDGVCKNPGGGTAVTVPNVQKCSAVGDSCCYSSQGGVGQCAPPLTCGSTGKCVAATTTGGAGSVINQCATTAGNTCGYMNIAGCPDGVRYCTSGSSCDSDNNYSNGIQGPAEGKTGRCVNATTTSGDPKPPADNGGNGSGGNGGGSGGGGGGGNMSCAGGIWCDEAPTTYTGAPGETICGQRDAGGTCRTGICNGSTGKWQYVGDSCSPRTQTPTTGDATLNFTLKFQGVTGEPRGGKTVPFKVKLKGSTVTDYVAGTLTADSSGKWTGSVNFSGIALGPDTKYTVYIKAGKHLQKRVCGFAPTESPAGTYNCSDSAIPLTSGVNNLDFSGILQLVGDLPSESGDQNGVVDSYDISYVLNNLGNTEEGKLAIGDLNFDGIIDSQDRSLIIQSLNVKYDDE